MMTPKKLLLTRILPVLLLIAIAYGWWYTRPAQIINRRADSLIQFLEYRSINLDNEQTYTNQISNLFADPLTLKMEITDAEIAGISSGSYSHTEMLKHLKELHTYTTSISPVQKSRSYEIDGKEATMLLTLEIKASAGQNFSRTKTYDLTLTLHEEKDWKITELTVKETPGS